jgi:hypothetical protein
MPASSLAPRRSRHVLDRHSRKAVLTDCGGLVIAVVSDDEAWLDLARKRFATFPASGGPDLTVIHGIEGCEPPLASRVFTRATAGFDAWYDPSTREAILPHEADLEALDDLLRVLLPRLLLDGLAFHATVLAGAGRGLLCVGACGAGKSTLAGLLPTRALCDEIGVVRRTPGGFAVHSTPFWKGSSGSAPLAGVFVLRHGETDARRLVAPGAAAGVLARHAFWPTDDPRALRRGFVVLTDVAARVPVYDLAFRPTPEVWQTIAAEAAS